MNWINELFFHLTPTTLAAIVADLDGEERMRDIQRCAMAAGSDILGPEDFAEFVAKERAAIIEVRRPANDYDDDNQYDEDNSGYYSIVAAGLGNLVR